MKRIFILALTGMLLTSASFSKDMSNRYYDHVHLGEKKFKDYHGPWDPKSYFNDLDGRVHFDDEKFIEEFFDTYQQDGLTPFTKTWLDEIPVKSSCPDFYLDQNIDYIRYLYRLLSISYLYESIKHSHFRLYSLGLNEKGCRPGPKYFLKNCNPKTADMKKFIQRAMAKNYKSLSPSNYKRFNKKLKKSWMDTYEEQSNIDLAAFRSEAYCAEHPKSCVSNLNKRVEKTLIGACEEDVKLIQMICSEEDDLFGISYAPDIVELLGKSNAAKNINKGGYGLQCLERYTTLFKDRERIYHQLKLFPMISLHVRKSKQRYLQGELFLPGALKEFDDKGLADFLFVAPKPKPKPIPKIVVKPKPKPKPKPVPKPKPKVVVKPKPKPVPKPKPKKVVKKLSAFELAITQRMKNKLDRAPVHMGRFKKENKFSKTVLKALEEPLKIYQTRSALKDMKKYDDLGSKDEPVRLMFIKYLLEKNLHQGLFNVVGVIGERFFVLNDIENKQSAVYVELKNDESTGFQWKLSVLGDPPKKKKKAKKK